MKTRIATTGFRATTRLATLGFLISTCLVAKGDFRQMTGNLGDFLNSIVNAIPGADSEAFIKPSTSDMAEFRDAITNLLRRNYQTAANLADPQGYDLIEFSDSSSDLQPYYVLVERTGSGFGGLGTYAFNPAARRRINIQAPHVPSDTDTGPESIQAFLQLDAEFWQMNGTHRCANRTPTPCTGGTVVCDGDFRVSDVAHFTTNFFQIANDTVAATLPGMFSIQLHAFPVCTNSPDPDDTPLAQLSMVTSARYANSMATRLAREINQRAVAAGYAGRGAVSWNAPDAESDVQATSENTCDFSGRSNVQGRSLHGSPDPCRDEAEQVPSPERFLHLEQRSLLTRAGAGISREIVIAAIADEFPAPPQRWVRFAHSGPELGTYAFPHNTLAEATAAATDGETIRIRAGSTSETGIFGRRCTLDGFDGAAVIGN